MRPPTIPARVAEGSTPPCAARPPPQTPCPSADRPCRATPPAPNPTPHGSARNGLCLPAHADPHSPPHTPSPNSCARILYRARAAPRWCSMTYTASLLPPNPLVSEQFLHAHNTTLRTTRATETTARASRDRGTLWQSASRNGHMLNDE